MPRKKGYRNIDMTITEPIVQNVVGSTGRYQYKRTKHEELTVKEFEKLSNSEK